MSVTHYSGIAHAKVGTAYRAFYKQIHDDTSSKKKVLNCNINNLTTEEVLEKLTNFTTGNDIKISNELIKRLSITVTKLGGTVDDKDNKTIVESVEKHLPDPDYKNTTIKATNNKIEQIAKTVARIINDDIFTTKVVDSNLETPILLRDINIYLYDLSYTLHDELSQSKLIINNTIDKLNTLNELLEESKPKDSLNKLIKELRVALATLETNEEIVTKEMKHHTTKFSRINEDLKNWEADVEKLQGDTIARLLSTIKHVVTITYLNNTILSSISTELPQTKDIYKTLRSINKSRKDEFKITTQVDAVKNYFTNRNSIVGGGMEFDFASEVATSAGEVSGGGNIDPASFLEGGARIDLEGMTPEQLEKKKKKDRAVHAVREYVSEMNVDINEFTENVYEASKFMGTTTYDTSKLRDYLENMKWVEGLRDPNIYLAMVGYYLDDTYRAAAGQYEERLEKTARGLKELGKHLPGTSASLNRAAGNIYNIIKTVDHFQDLLKTLLVGVCLEDIRDVVSEMPHAMGNIHLAINRLYHALNISQMRKMVKKCSGELSHYTKNYPELLALTVGGRRADLEREYRLLVADCPKGSGSILDPLTGKKLEYDPTAGPGGVNPALNLPPGTLLPDAEARARLLAETLQPGGILLSRCSLIWRYKNLADSRAALPPPVGPMLPGANPVQNLEYLLKTKEYLEPFDKFLKEVEGEFRAKHRVYKAMESLDLLLSAFTKEVAGDIDLMKEVKKYLEDTKVYTKWFTDYTGDLMAAIFESMPAYISVYAGNRQFENLKKASDPPTTAYDGLSTFNYPNVTMGTPLDMTGCAFGTPEYNTLSQDLKNPVCISFYYKQLSNTIRQSGGLPLYGKATGVPCMKGATKLRKNIDEFYNNFQALKNIFHSFITLYNRIISRGVRSKSLMTPSQIYYSILSYLKQSALARRLQPGDQNCHNMCEGALGFQGRIEDPGYPPCIPFRTTWYTSLVGMILPAYYPTRLELHCYSVGEETGYPNYPTPAPGVVPPVGWAPPADRNLWNEPDKNYRNNISNTYKSVYETEDRLCAMGIKSIASVVLSCMGLFTIQQQPVNMGLQKTVRGIIGGGGKAETTGGLLSLTSVMGDDFRDPNTVCAAASCNLFDSYYYVTRLCEFYKMLFKNMMQDEESCQFGAPGTCVGNMQLRVDERYDCKIRLPVNLEGDFGKILYTVANNSGVYGDRDACIIINQINKLSSKYRSVDDMLCGLIGDVNRRFSCVLDEESQFKFESLENRLCPETLANLGSTYCKKTFGCKARGSQSTGSMPFDDEHPDDSDPVLLDDTITPSDSLMEVAEKYNLYNSQTSGCRVSVGKERSVAKLNFCGEFKLFHKLARMRSMLDEMFDEYLRTQYDACRDNKRPRTLKHFPLSTDFYRESFHEDFVDQMKVRCHAAKGCKKTAFVIATDLLNSKGRGTIDDKLGGNTDTLFAFSETVALMSNCLYNARNILKTCLEDVAVFSGERIYHDFATENLTTADNLGGAGGTLAAAQVSLAGGGGAVADFFWTLLDQGTRRALVNYAGTITGGPYQIEDLRLDQCIEFETAPALPGGNWLENADVLNTLYMTVIYKLMTKRGGIKLLGIGNLTAAARMKDCIYSIWVCKPEMRPHNIAKSIVLGGQYRPGLTAPRIPGQAQPATYTYNDLPSDKKALLIKETINQLMLRFDLTAVQSNSIGTIARLSSSMDGLVSTTISTQGTFMDITPVQNLVIDCMGELKNYASRFYDVLPAHTMSEYYQRSEPGSAGKRSSIYDMEYDLTTYFDPHVVNKIKRLPLVAVVNKTMTTVHKSLVGDLRQVLYTPDQLELRANNNDLTTMYNAGGAAPHAWQTAVQKFSAGGNSIVNAIMPSHYEPHPINVTKDFLSLSGGSVLGSSSRFVDMFKQFTGTGAPPGGAGNNECLKNICSDFAEVDWTNINLIDSISNGDNIEALLPAFNHGIRSMLVSFYDYGSRKIYKGVLDMLMTDKLSQNVESLETSYPDLFAQTVATGDHLHLALPQPGSILCSSIAILMRLLFSSINNRNQTNPFVYDSLAEIKNASLIEVMKLKLPMFREYFIKLVNKCRVMRGFLTKGCGSRENKRRLISVTQPFSRLVGGVGGQHVVYQLNEGRFAIGGAAGLIENAFTNYVDNITMGDKIQLAGLTNARRMIVGGASLVQPLDAKLGGHDGGLSDDTLYAQDTSDEWRYGYFMELISNLEDSCISIANSCDSLLGEFTSDDQYMVPGMEYIAKHKKKYNHPTFRPLSLTSAFTSLVPAFKGLHNLNSRREGSSFKLQFGARGILYSDDMKFLNSKYLEPILCAIREGTKSSSVRVDTSSYGNFAKNYLSLFRFNFSVLNYSQICAIAGDYKSADFQGGELADIVGGANGQGMVNEILNKYDLSQLHIPGMGEYTSGRDLTVIYNRVGNLMSTDGSVVTGNKDVGYTCRKISGNSPHNPTRIWMVEYLYNYVEFGTGRASGSMLERKEFTNAEAQRWIDEFNQAIQTGAQTLPGVPALAVAAARTAARLDRVLLWVGLYNLWQSGSLTSGKDLAITTLQEAGPTIIQDINYEIGRGAPPYVLLNIDGRNYDRIYQALEKTPTLINADDLKNHIFGIVATSSSAANKGVRYNSVWDLVSGHVAPPPIPPNRTYRTLLERAFIWDQGRLYRYLNTISLPLGVGNVPAAFAGNVVATADWPLLRAGVQAQSGGAAPIALQAEVLAKYNLPIYALNQVWTGNATQIEPAPAGSTLQLTGGTLTGGTLTANSIYNLMDPKRIGPPSGLIYTTTPIATPELLLNIITGDDVKELIEVMTEVISSGSGDNVGTATQCGQSAVSPDNSEQRSSLIAMLIEKNLNPINVHAMQRFIPFANIYNYSYTFDRFVYTMYNIQMPWMDIIHAGYGQSLGANQRNEHCTKPGQQIMCFKNIFQSTDPSWQPGRVRQPAATWSPSLIGQQPADPSEIDVSSTYYADIVKETFIRMMMDPYAHIDQYVYGVPVGENAMAANFGPVTRMMRGFDRLGMGVPKFLSDQLLTKALLNSMYLGAQYGPTVESSVYRFNLHAPPEYAPAAPGGVLPILPAGPGGFGATRMGPTPITVSTARTVTGGVGSPGIPARETEEGIHSTFRNYQGLVAPVSAPIGRDIATWPKFEQDHVLPGLMGTFGPDKITLSDSGVSPANYGVDAINVNAPIKQLIVVNQLPFYDPDTRQVLTYDLGRVFKLNNQTRPLIPQANPLPAFGIPGAAAALAPATDGQEQNLINMFRYEGYERFNTQLVRNVIFITNLQRMMRYSLNMWLSRAYGSVSRDHRALSAEVTERRLGNSMGITDDREYEDVQQSWI